VYVHIHVHEPAFGCGCVYRAGRYTEFTRGCTCSCVYSQSSHVGVNDRVYSRIYTQNSHACVCIY